MSPALCALRPQPLGKEQAQAVKGFGTTQPALVINRTVGKKLSKWTL